MVHDDGDSGRANPDEAAHFFGGVEKGAAKVVGVMEDGDLLFVVGREEKTLGLVEPRHFYVEACLKIHRAGEIGDVSIAGLVHHGDQVKQGFPEGVEGHGVAFFYFYMIAMAADGFGFDDKRIGGIMTKGSLQGILAMRCKLPLCAGIHWRHTGIHWVLESGAVSVGDAPISFGYRNLARAGDSR